MNDLMLHGKVLKNNSLFLRFYVFGPFIIWPISFLTLYQMFKVDEEFRQFFQQFYTQYTVFFNIMILWMVIGMVLYLRIAFISGKKLRKIQVKSDGLTIIHLFKENQFVRWEEIIDLKLISSPSRTTTSYQAPDVHSWKTDTAIGPKFGLSKKSYNFFITSTHESYKVLLALISEKTGLEVEYPKKQPRKPNIPTWQSGIER